MERAWMLKELDLRLEELRQQKRSVLASSRPEGSKKTCLCIVKRERQLCRFVRALLEALPESFAVEDDDLEDCFEKDGAHSLRKSPRARTIC